MGVEEAVEAVVIDSGLVRWGWGAVWVGRWWG